MKYFIEAVSHGKKSMRLLSFEPQIWKRMHNSLTTKKSVALQV